MILAGTDPDNYSLNGYAMPTLVVGVAIAALGASVLVRERGSLIGKLFLLMCLSVSLYLVATGVNYASRDDGLSLLWIRISQLGSVFIPTTVLLLTVARLGRSIVFALPSQQASYCQRSLFLASSSRICMSGEAPGSSGVISYNMGRWGSCILVFSSVLWSSSFASTGRNTGAARPSYTGKDSEV